MQPAVLLAIAASFCTATASLAQHTGAKSVQNHRRIRRPADAPAGSPTGLAPGHCQHDRRLCFPDHRVALWRTGLGLAGEFLALALVVIGAATLSRSCFILGEVGDPSCLPAEFRARSAPSGSRDIRSRMDARQG